MLITHEREKLINAIIYFSQNTKFCGKVKLFKLLYFLDFEHFKIAGRSVTGLDYYAWKMGPVPTALSDEIDCPEPDLAEAIEISEIPTRWQPMLTFRAKAGFDSKHFTRRELELLEGLSREYCDAKSEDMIEATHLENLPWDKVFRQEGKERELIPYEYALRAQEKEEMLRLVSERSQLLEKLS